MTQVRSCERACDGGGSHPPPWKSHSRLIAQTQGRSKMGGFASVRTVPGGGAGRRVLAVGLPQSVGGLAGDGVGMGSRSVRHGPADCRPAGTGCSCRGCAGDAIAAIAHPGGQQDTGAGGEHDEGNGVLADEVADAAGRPCRGCLIHAAPATDMGAAPNTWCVIRDVRVLGRIIEIPPGPAVGG